MKSNKNINRKNTKHKSRKINKQQKHNQKQLRGGSIRYDSVKQQFYGVNKPGENDAELLNYLEIKWYGEGPINLIDFYKYPHIRINGFNFSLLESIDNKPQRPDIRDILSIITDIISSRSIDAEEHYKENNRLRPGHAYVYAVMLWLNQFITDLYIYHRPLNNLLRERDRYIEIYKQEFFNLFTQERQKRTRQVKSYRTLDDGGELVEETFVTRV